jgi:hypothetical protein
MPHPVIDNATPLVIEPVFLEDEDGRPTLTTVVKATFDILPRARLVLADVQRPVDAAGTFWGPPETSSYRFEPEVTPLKLATDVVVVGHAHAPRAGTTTSMDVGVRVGPVSKGLRVLGERMWYRVGVGHALTAPRPFERIPVQYERAFGGWDRSDPDPSQHACERRNTVGRGFHAARSSAPSAADLAPNMLAPNIEDPAALIEGWRDRPAPAGFGFTLPGWLPRASLGGTFDAQWEATRKPRLPADFDRRFYNGASPGLVAPGLLRGDEPVSVLGMRPEGGLAFSLPGIPPPALRVSIARRPDERPPLALDTVILDMDEAQLLLLWRARIRLPNGPADLRGMELVSEPAGRFPRADGAAA